MDSTKVSVLSSFAAAVWRERKCLSLPVCLHGLCVGLLQKYAKVQNLFVNRHN